MRWKSTSSAGLERQNSDYEYVKWLIQVQIKICSNNSWKDYIVQIMNPFMHSLILYHHINFDTEKCAMRTLDCPCCVYIGFWVWVLGSGCIGCIGFWKPTDIRVVWHNVSMITALGLRENSKGFRNYSVILKVWSQITSWWLGL